MLWGKTLVAEKNAPNQMPELVPVGRDKDAMSNWKEISKEQYIKLNYHAE